MHVTDYSNASESAFNIEELKWDKSCWILDILRGPSKVRSSSEVYGRRSYGCFPQVYPLQEQQGINRQPSLTSML